MEDTTTILRLERRMPFKEDMTPLPPAVALHQNVIRTLSARERQDVIAILSDLIEIFKRCDNENE